VGYFIFGNHTQPVADAFTPNMLGYPKRCHVVISSKNFSLPVLGPVLPELGGIQMESTDNGVCSCPACLKRRGVASLDEPISLADMAAIYPDASETIRRVNPEALIICETYHHFLDKECSIFAEKSPSPDLKKLLSMPETTFWQWKCDQMLKDGE